jgi:hypothetical protein
MRLIPLACIALMLSACSSISSYKGATAKDGDGLVYYLPKKDFVVTVTRGNDKFTGITIDTTLAYADLARAYVMQFGTNPFGKNRLDISIGPTGLLSSSKSTTTPGVTEALAGLGKLGGMLKAKSGAQKDAGPEVVIPSLGIQCDAATTHTFVFDVGDLNKDGAMTICDKQFTVTVERLWDQKNVSKVSSAAADASAYAGVFYRQHRPYLLRVEGQGLNQAAIVASPSESGELFLPAARTLFSKNDADFGFVDGIPTKYVQEVEGELVALFQLPATVLNAYFEAIGGLFARFSTNDKAQAAALADSTKLQLAKQRYDLCLAAINAKDDKLVGDLKCAGN